MGSRDIVCSFFLMLEAAFKTSDDIKESVFIKIQLTSNFSVIMQIGVVRKKKEVNQLTSNCSILLSLTHCLRKENTTSYALK